jgi:hypothetical protein
MPDKLEIKFLDVEFFVLEDNSQNVQQDGIVRLEIPRQIANGGKRYFILTL